MADNITFQATVATPPSGAVVATDDVAGVQFQKVKIDVGGDGVSTILSTSNPLPVSQQGTVTVTGTVTANLSTSTYGGMTALTLDYDSAGTTQDMPIMGLALPGSGGAVAGGTFTNPIRIDPTGTTVQPVSDGGSSLTVDGSVSLAAAIPAGNNNIGDVDIASIAAGDNLFGRVKISDGTTVATVANYTNSKPLHVTLRDTNGDYVAAGGGTQYTEDAASAADPVGSALMLRRRDTLSGTEVSADGDNIAANATSKGELYVKHVDTIAVTDNGGTLSIDDGAGSITVDGTVAVSGTVPVSDAAGSLTVDAPVGTPVFVRLSDGASAITALPVTDNAGSLTVDGTVGISGTVPVTDNSGSLTVDAPVTTPVFVRLSDGAAAITALPVTDNGGTLTVDDGGSSLTVDGTVTVNVAAGTNNIGDVDVLTVPAPLSTTGNGTAATALRVTVASDSTGVIAVTGNVAHDAAASGNPFQVAGEARSTDRAVVQDADVARIITTLLGKTIVQPYAGPGLTWNYAAASGGITNTTGVTAKAAGGAGVRNYITMAQVINGHASVDTDVQIRDGAAGTVLWRGFAKSGGGGVSAKFDPPLRGTANTLIEIACGTSGSATYVNLQGYTSTE